ncbi:hypothetical protein HRJ45_09535 [Vibrio coralliilyticus]|uniref:hypothetical protein n=1 Tax=Vibrio coralliilyticus TaxID=190893 RepID=UPI0015619B0A|nr:hypothetical protein [Vibrio coralliilyticus]NRF25158.1 hypothetical protein [Vibrio coralliilyticus]NRF79342.1 hypothetical protein [Vibrio coralliilyticus]
MKKIIPLLLSVGLLFGCGEDDGKTYVGENNFYTMEPTKIRQFTEDSGFVSQQQLMPTYFVYRAKEWPREDLNDASSYDLPRVQFFWANLSNDRGYEPHPMYNEYEGQVKIWSMKTDGTDLRLVVDEFPVADASGSGKMVRSPNNRYLAFGYGGSGKAVYDLKTKETYDLADRGPIGFLWAEDSSYLYYRTRDTSGQAVYKWDATTQESTKVDFSIYDTGVIFNDVRYVLGVGGLRTNDDVTEEQLSILSWAEGMKTEEAVTTDRAISPQGKYSWAKNRFHTFYIDSSKEIVKKNDANNTSGFPYIVGLDAKYISTSKNAMVMEVRELATKKAWSWRPLGHNRTLENISLYNAFANEGNWFKESK